jgi:predicted ATPase/DNA-binding winged helix-turn-helix (wHTH) protein
MSGSPLKLVSPTPVQQPAPDAADVADRLRFGRAELQPRERRLLVDGKPVALGARAFDLLLAFVERPGQLITRNELIERVWPGVVVEENNLSVQVNALRKALGGDAVATIPGRGYRFTAATLDDRSDATATERDAGVPLPSAPVGRLRSNLPATPTPLIGRDDVLATVRALLDAHRVVTLVGAGGIGKSLLAQHLLAARETHHAHGVCYVELASVNDASTIVATVAAALDVRIAGGGSQAALVQALAPLDILLALDNAEHMLADVARLVDAVHSAAPGVRLLVTSQAPLRLACERVVRLGPLAVPPGPLPAAEAMRFSAVALFVDHARAGDARFELSDADAPAVIELVRRLDGVALAIELAAARVPGLGVQGVSAAMDEQLRLLVRGRNRSAPARQQTLRAALEWSHALLDERERAVFRRLAVIAGSASLTLIRRVAACARWDEWDVIDALDTLVERSLVAVIAEPGDLVRYRLLEAPRAYACERLAAVDEASEVRRLHALAVRDVFGAQRDDYEAGRSLWSTGLTHLLPDADNAREAFAWARAAAQSLLALDLGRLLSRSLAPSALSEREALLDACEPLITAGVPAWLRVRAWLDLTAGSSNSGHTRFVEMVRLAVATARAMPTPGPGDPPLLYFALCRLATAHVRDGDEAQCRRAYDEAMSLERAEWPAAIRTWGAEATINVALTYGAPAAAIPVLRRCVALYREAGVSVGGALNALVDAQIAAGDARAAVASGRELVAEFEGSRDQLFLAFSRLNLAAAHLVLDESTAAAPVLRAAWEQTGAFEFLKADAGSYLALYAALDRRPDAAARIAGWTAARYVAIDERPQHNEAAAMARAMEAARRALGDVEALRLHHDGGQLAGTEVFALAFGTEADSAQ